MHMPQGPRTQSDSTGPAACRPAASSTCLQRREVQAVVCGGGAGCHGSHAEHQVAALLSKQRNEEGLFKACRSFEPPGRRRYVLWVRLVGHVALCAGSKFGVAFLPVHAICEKHQNCKGKTQPRMPPLAWLPKRSKKVPLGCAASAASARSRVTAKLQTTCSWGKGHSSRQCFMAC